MGCKGYFIGFESGNDRVLKFIRKGTTREVNIQAARICRRYGIKIWANYMLGLPTETRDEVLDTISMLKEIDPDVRVLICTGHGNPRDSNEMIRNGALSIVRKPFDPDKLIGIVHSTIGQ